MKETDAALSKLIRLLHGQKCPLRIGKKMMGDEKMNLEYIGRISAINAKSTTGAFKDAAIGDKIIFTCPMTRSGRNGDSTYAKYIHIINERTGGESDLSFNQIEKILSKFEFVKM